MYAAARELSQEFSQRSQNLHHNVKVLRQLEKTPKVSVILLDWGVRESFHTLDYLDSQTVPRSEYEVIWIEFYNRVPPALRQKVEEAETKSRPLIDQWIIVGATAEIYFHKHFAYNIGIALARGEICVICDSDAMYPKNFLKRLLDTFANEPPSVVHVDQIRNANRRFYPFGYPEPEAVIADPMTINWTGKLTRGLDDSQDMLHEANYGACMAARRSDLIAIGGADEHLDYLGYICGPYEMTFRLVNFGRKEIWLEDIFLIHTWHPSEGGTDNLGGPNDGRGMSLSALEARSTGRWRPLVENPAIAMLRERPAGRNQVLTSLSQVDHYRWKRENPNLRRLDPPVLIRENVGANNIVRYGDIFYLFPHAYGAFLPSKAKQGEYAGLLQASSLEELVNRTADTQNASGQARPSVETVEVIDPSSRGFQIVRWEGLFYAIPKSAGSISAERAAAGEYAYLPQADGLENLQRKLLADQRVDRNIIEQSGLFDPAFYVETNPDAAGAGIDALTHYVNCGATEGRSPHPLFDAAYYLNQNPDVAGCGVNPLTHFVLFGAAEGRKPNWLFDTEYYLRRNPDVVAAQVNPLLHFLRTGALELRRPHPLFDTRMYLERNQDVAASGENPLSHFLRSGAHDQLPSTVLFDADYYLNQRGNDSQAKANPFRDFLEIGHRLNLNPHRLFQTAYYRALAGLSPEEEPLSHFVDVGGGLGLSPHPVFHSGFYLKEHPELAVAGVNPLEHFLLRGGAEESDPNPLFNTKEYLKRHPEAAQSGKTALEHFLSTPARTTKASLSSSSRSMAPLSVVITTHNGGQVLAPLIETCLRHAGEHRLDVIVVDDGSTDGTPALLAEFAKHAPSLRTIRTRGVGIGSAKNRGVEIARHDVILFLDDDLVPDNADLFRIHASAHATWPGRDLAVLGRVTWPCDVLDYDLELTDLIGGLFEEKSGFVSLRYFHAANLSLRRSVITNWLGEGFRGSAGGPLLDAELAYRISRRLRQFRLLYAPDAIARHTRRLDWERFLEQQVGTGRALADWLPNEPQAAQDMGWDTVVGALYRSPAVVVDHSHTINLVKTAFQGEPKSPRKIMEAALGLCRLQGFTQAIASSGSEPGRVVGN